MQLTKHIIIIHILEVSYSVSYKCSRHNRTVSDYFKKCLAEVC